MKKTVLTILIVLFAVISVYGATNEDETYNFSYALNDGEKLEKTYKSSDVLNIELEPNDQLAFYIPANATTGFQWVLKDDFEDKFVQLLSSEYIAPDSELMGAGGTSVWIFKALEEGVTTLAFEYIRPWEEDVDPNIILLIQVHVKAK